MIKICSYKPKSIKKKNMHRLTILSQIFVTRDFFYPYQKIFVNSYLLYLHAGHVDNGGEIHGWRDMCRRSDRCLGKLPANLCAEVVVHSVLLINHPAAPSTPSPSSCVSESSPYSIHVSIHPAPCKWHYKYNTHTTGKGVTTGTAVWSRRVASVSWPDAFL